ncbi:MAG: tail fiber protein [Bacilli bacterium]|nr:tail fiber protein [Bacilli bacterium]
MNIKKEFVTKEMFESYKKEQQIKSKKHTCIMLALCLFLCGIASVSSYSFGASSVAYTPKDASWQVENTQEAIDNLFDSVGSALVGSVYSYMGVNAPAGYLACDGTVYEISKYPRLANHIKVQFGTYNYFGGDGETTFAVPDLRGEFLRGTGTNSHTQSIANTSVTEGSGASVGKHQGSTVLRNIWHYDNSSNVQAIWYSNTSSGINSNEGMSNADKWMVASTHSRSITYSASLTANNTNYVGFSTRPTNTSVLFIIKY